MLVANAVQVDDGVYDVAYFRDGELTGWAKESTLERLEEAVRDGYKVTRDDRYSGGGKYVGKMSIHRVIWIPATAGGGRAGR